MHDTQVTDWDEKFSALALGLIHNIIQISGMSQPKNDARLLYQGFSQGILQFIFLSSKIGVPASSNSASFLSRNLGGGGGDIYIYLKMYPTLLRRL